MKRKGSRLVGISLALLLLAHQAWAGLAPYRCSVDARAHPACCCPESPDSPGADCAPGVVQGNCCRFDVGQSAAVPHAVDATIFVGGRSAPPSPVPHAATLAATVGTAPRSLAFASLFSPGESGGVPLFLRVSVLLI